MSKHSLVAYIIISTIKMGLINSNLQLELSFQNTSYMSYNTNNRAGPRSVVGRESGLIVIRLLWTAEMPHCAAFHLGLHCLPKYSFRSHQYKGLTF